MNINNINNWLNSLNEFQEGLSLIIFGCLVFVISKFLHKDYTHDGYKPFKSFRRKNKSQSEDNFFIIMYIRSLGGIYTGIGITLFGLYKILKYFF
ncbi:hypothetical protein ATB99_03495 [Elizabethkingia meningoseptica]|uniref:hypothetical protein n=1 Tax=Elizabethkingia meningoseptica TaxID=238 RepID=UPI000364D161|nr:hypothetical protein [Elizabethkingia meningoseptica]AQX04294.1 hypothetical protein BBD33_03090 [Elizabethkingia meningoseptica]AQX46336.1 hypothetical protein B5G46_03085 [Elizabethkingia meningoseptica]KUY18852.1 hypothetical protein ATB99_03495 [Elizabethkingia meningoseptica]OPB73175.1 hypothetical protein BAY30_14080 [Elizabethkingia meningoseptica]SQG06880.1 Uncharacterised protein [Elizabethkingia meningoseptica]